MKKIKRVIIACLLPAVFISCSHSLKGNLPVNAESVFNFRQKIAELKKIADGKGDNKSRARAHREIAFLYYQTASPEVDYEKALKELESYIALEPAGTGMPEIRDMLGVLRALEKQRMKIAELTKNINMLQSLDVELEKQRELMK